MGKQQELSLTLTVVHHLLSASPKAWTESCLQEPGKGEGSSLPRERWHQPGSLGEPSGREGSEQVST